MEQLYTIQSLKRLNLEGFLELDVIGFFIVDHTVWLPRPYKGQIFVWPDLGCIRQVQGDKYSVLVNPTLILPQTFSGASSHWRPISMVTLIEPGQIELGPVAEEYSLTPFTLELFQPIQIDRL